MSDPTTDEDLGALLEQEMAGGKAELPPKLETKVQTELPLDAEPEEEPAAEPAVVLQAPVDEMAELRAEIAALKARPGIDSNQVQAQLARIEAERAAEKQAAEAAQRDTRIRTLKALKVQAIEAEDRVAAERYSDELDDAKRERDLAVVMAQVRPQQQQQREAPPPAEFNQHMHELQQWRIDNKVWDEAEFNAAAAHDRLLREDPSNAGKYATNRAMWDAALNKVRGAKAPPPKAKPTYAPSVEGAAARAPAAPKAAPRRTAKESLMDAELRRHSGLSQKDWES